MVDRVGHENAIRFQTLIAESTQGNGKERREADLRLHRPSAPGNRERLPSEREIALSIFRERARMVVEERRRSQLRTVALAITVLSSAIVVLYGLVHLWLDGGSASSFVLKLLFP